MRLCEVESDEQCVVNIIRILVQKVPIQEANNLISRGYSVTDANGHYDRSIFYPCEADAKQLCVSEDTLLQIREVWPCDLSTTCID